MDSHVHGVAVLADPDTEAALVEEIGRHRDTLEVQRRCADLAEVLAATRAGIVDLVCIDGEDPDLDARLLEEIRGHGAGIVILAGSHRIRDLMAMGADAVIGHQQPARAVEALLALVRVDLASRRALGAEFGPTSPDTDFFPPAPQVPTPGGRILVVWGTTGAPGRSTTALAVASIVGAQIPTLLIDADTANPSIAHMLAIPPEPSGVSALSRIGARGRISPVDLTRAAVPIVDRLDVLTGIAVPQRWRETGPAPMVEILTTAQQLYGCIVVDVGAVSLDPVGSEMRHQGSRDELTAAILRQADDVLLVGRADAIGIHRIVAAHEWWLDNISAPRLHIMVNRYHSHGVGKQGMTALRIALNPFIEGKVIHIIPEDVAVLSAQLHADTLPRFAPKSQALQAWRAQVSDLGIRHLHEEMQR